jgi:hypothetical protein
MNIHRQLPLINRYKASLLLILKHIKPESVLIQNMNRKNILALSKYLQKNSYPGEKVELAIDRVDNLSDADFVKKYLNPGLPVIFNQQAADWVCTKKWNLDFFGDYFSEHEFSIIDSSGLVEKEYDKTQGNQTPVFLNKIKGADFVRALRAGEKHYLRFCPVMETHPELRKDLDQSWLKRMRRCFLGISYQTFIGARGRKTPLHSETTAFFYVMAEGEKKWNLFSPNAHALLQPKPEGRGYNYSNVVLSKLDNEKFPGVTLLQRYTCTLKKGDILFVPAWMWHEVENITDGWGLSYRFTSLRGFFKFPVFATIRLFFTKPGFVEILYYSFFKSDIAKRDKNLLTPKIFLKED